MTTMSALETDAVVQVKHLMGGRDAVAVASWAHKVNAKFPWTLQLHFQRQPSTSCQRAEMIDCPDNRCILKGLRHFYGRLIGTPFAEIPWPETMKLTDADAVKYLINLMGDLHQPMHFAPEADANLTVEFRGTKMSLYDFWDTGMTQAVIKSEPGFWWGGWTHVERTRAEYEQDGQAWKKDGIAVLDRWADDTATFMCNNIFRNTETNRPLRESMGADGVVRIDEGLYMYWKRAMLSRILVAGARTAILLNAILHHREGAKLNGGSAVNVAVDEGAEGSDEDDSSEVLPQAVLNRHEIPKGTRAKKGLHALALNAGIASIVLLCFLQIMRFWQGAAVAAVKSANQEKQRSTGKKI